MSAATVHDEPLDAPDDGASGRRGDGPDARVVGRPVVVRRNAGLAALVGGSASAIAIAYLWRASTSGAVLDWALCALMAALAALYLVHLVDARTPLLVADDLGMRIRLGSHWRGLPWDAVAAVVVAPRRGPLRDGRLAFEPHPAARALDGLDSRGRRAAARNRRRYGAALAVPIGLGTRVSSRGRDLSRDLALLAGDRAEVRTGPVEAAAEPGVEPGPGLRPVPHPARRSILGGLGTVVSRAAKHRSRDLEQAPDPAAPAAAEPVRTDDPGADPGQDGVPAVPTVRSAVQLRAARRGLRAQVTRDLPATAVEDPDPPQQPEPGGRPDGEPDPGVHLVAALDDPVAAPVLDDAVQPAADPVIGPELAAARARVGLTVDELADRTRIRPHVIESIEVDDFAPCGGDFYARGHLRTLARVLGRDVGPMLAHYDDRYATAPVDARRVFEAELATGMTASARRTAGGPSWALMLGVVLAVALTWGVVRLFESQPPERLQSPVPSVARATGVDVGSGFGATGPAPATRPVTLSLTGSRGGSSVVVRDGTGAVLWSGRLAPGERRTLRVSPPVRVRAEDAGAVAALVDGRDEGPVGQPGEPGARLFARPAAR